VNVSLITTTGSDENQALVFTYVGYRKRFAAPDRNTVRVKSPDGWSEAEGALQREFRFANFTDALAFVNRVGELAEAENHHPDIELGWGRVVLRWRSHSADAITDRDRELARRSAELEHAP